MAIGNATGAAAISDMSESDQPSAAMPSISQLRWHCRRGMLELDVMFRRFLDQHYPSLDLEDQQCFVELLTLEDDQLWDWLSGRFSPSDPQQKQLVEQIRRPANA